MSITKKCLSNAASCCHGDGSKNEENKSGRESGGAGRRAKEHKMGKGAVEIRDQNQAWPCWVHVLPSHAYRIHTHLAHERERAKPDHMPCMCRTAAEQQENIQTSVPIGSGSSFDAHQNNCLIGRQTSGGIKRTNPCVSQHAPTTTASVVRS